MPPHDIAAQPGDAVAVLRDAVRGRVASPYVVSRRYDWAFFLSPPLLALALGIWVSGSDLALAPTALFGEETAWRTALLGVLIHAHLVAVFLRSHGNREVFSTYPLRFTLVPLSLCVAMNLSLWVMVSCSVLATFWDVYHSGAQTFGFGRIYDRRAGNDPARGRRLDFWLNQLLYAGPVLAGATLMAHVNDFMEFEHIGEVFFLYVPSFVEGHSRYLTWGVVGGGALFIGYYLAAYAQLASEGYRVSSQKVFLYASTGAVSIYSWGFNSWGEAFVIMNVFHAVQYLALVWARERTQLVGHLRLSDSRLSGPIALTTFLGGTAIYGYFVVVTSADVRLIWSLTTTVALMHFWYDGFVWSVRRGQV